MRNKWRLLLFVGLMLLLTVLVGCSSPPVLRPSELPSVTPTPTPTPTRAPVPSVITPTPTPTPTPMPFIYSLEKIPGSLNHSLDSTWWGHNQSKIARYGDTVFTYVVHNNNDPATKSLMPLYKKVGEGPWEQGASMPCSRPGNVLIDSDGGLHALIFDPEDVLANNSLAAWNTTISPSQAMETLRRSSIPRLFPARAIMATKP